MTLVHGHEFNHAARPFDKNGEARAFDRSLVQDRWIARARRSVEGIPEPAGECGLSGRVHPDRDTFALQIGKGPKIVDAMGLVRMVVGIDNTIDARHVRRDHLFAKIRRCINHDTRDSPARIKVGPTGRPLDQQGTAATPVPRIVRVAVTPIAIGSRHTAG